MDRSEGHKTEIACNFLFVPSRREAARREQARHDTIEFIYLKKLLSHRKVLLDKTFRV